VSPRVLTIVLLAGFVAFIIPTAAHGDFFISAFNSGLLLTDDVNFYHAVADEPTAVFPNGLSGAPYGPLFYYPTAGWLFVLDRLHLIDVAAWSGTNDGSLRSLATILLVKLPNLAVYLLAAFVVARTVREEGRDIAALLWLANPAVILFTLMMGQNDAWTALASLAAMLFALRAIEDRPLRVAGLALPLRVLAMLSLAVGAAVKLSPIFLVPAFAWALGRSYRDRALLVAIGAIAFALMIAPFLGNEYFWDYGLFGQQAGKSFELPVEAAAALYAGYLLAVIVAARQDADRARVLLFAFLAFHALFYLLDGWSPQRSVLFIAALALAVPHRRLFAIPYQAVTAVALLLALEHRNEIAAGLFEPLSPRVVLVPPLLDGEPQPLHELLFWCAGASWLAALPALWLALPVLLPRLRWSPIVPVLLLGVLVGYFAAAFAMLPRGIERIPYQRPIASRDVLPGQTFSFYTFVAHDELRSFTIWLDVGATAGVRVSDAGGRTLFADPALLLERGANRLDVGRVEDASTELFTVELRPGAPLRVRMVELPEALVVSGATLDGEPIEGTARLTVEFRAPWRALLGDARAQLRDGWEVMVASGVVCAVGFAIVARRAPLSLSEGEGMG
jgi:hypothetical protein